MLSIFDGDMVSSCLHVCIPEDKLELMRRFDAGEIVKVQCFLGYNRNNCCVTLTVVAIELVTNVRVVVT